LNRVLPALADDRTAAVSPFSGVHATVPTR
jgi:hypothetical protein